MVAAAKLLRCLQMIDTLKKQRMTIKQLANRFQTSERTAYRYIDLFEEVGYEIQVDGKQEKKFSIKILKKG